LRLNAQEALLMRSNGSITTTAGFVGANGDGGNISIDTPFIVAVSRENSNIEANAFQGSGGNVRISAQAIFGIQVRPQSTPESDITASSGVGRQGEITINQPEVQPTQGTTELPTDIIDASNQIAQICPCGSIANRLGEFIVSGRGGVSSSPIDPLSGDGIVSSLVSGPSEVREAPSEGQSNPVSTESSITRSVPAVNPITAIALPEMIEAQGWSKTRNGKVVLIADSKSAAPAMQARCPVESHS
jgi:large exoprotein involved in heme utilization and adhesion